MVVSLRAFKYRFYPSQKQQKLLREWLALCWLLYNAALQERKEAWWWRQNGWDAPKTTYEQQTKSLTQIRASDPAYRSMPAVVARSALDRVDKAESSMIAARKENKKARTRFKKRDQYRSFSTPAGKRVIRHDGKSRMAGVRLCGAAGWGKIRYHRPIEGTPKQIHVKDCGERWFIVIICEVADDVAPTIDITTLPPERMVGIDVGIKSLGALSTGEIITNHRFGREGERIIGRRQRALSRKKKGSRSYDRQKELVRRGHAHVAEQRRQNAYAVANYLVRNFDVIFFEDLKIARMVHGKLAKSIYDAAWRMLLVAVSYKASRAGKIDKAVNPYGSTQECYGCGRLVPKDLSMRWHECDCGESLDRDVNAAKVILARGVAALCESVDASAGKPAKARRSTRSRPRPATIQS